MPAQPRWHADIDKIRSRIAALPSPFLDRPAIERLFSVKARQANNLMRSLGGYRIGQAAVVAREELLQKLDELARERGYLLQARRKARVVEALAELRVEARPRRIAPPPPRRPGSPLPEGARLSAPGALTISFSSPEELLGCVLGLAQAAAADFPAFAAGLEAAPEPAPQPEETSPDLTSPDGVIPDLTIKEK